MNNYLIVKEERVEGDTYSWNKEQSLNSVISYKIVGQEYAPSKEDAFIQFFDKNEKYLQETDLYYVIEEDGILRCVIDVYKSAKFI